jgi:tellurium resistance protein TerD
MVDIDLGKGGSAEVVVDVTKNTLSEIFVGLGWTPPPAAPGKSKWDFDLSMVGRSRDGKALTFMDGSTEKAKYLLFYNSKKLGDWAEHLGDDRDGEGGGSDETDDERARIVLDKVPADIDILDFAVTIYEAEKRNQWFESKIPASARLYDATSVNPDFSVVSPYLLRYKLDDHPESDGQTGMHFCRLIRNGNGGWDFSIPTRNFSRKYNTIGSFFNAVIPA